MTRSPETQAPWLRREWAEFKRLPPEFEAVKQWLTDIGDRKIPNPTAPAKADPK